MNQTSRNAAIQPGARRQEPVRRPTPVPAGYTTYEGGDFRSVRTAHAAYEPRSERPVREARSYEAARTPRAAEGGDFRIPRGERKSQAPADAREAREALELREEHEARSRQGARSVRGGHGRTPRGTRSSGGSGNGKRRGPAKPLIAVLALALLFGGFCLYKSANLTPAEATGGAFYDQSAAQIQEAVDHEVEDGYFNMSINTSVPVFEDNTAALGIKNIESNSYDCTVTVTLDDGREVYQSGGLAPGTELDMVTLTQQLEPGDYEATAVFDIYEQDEEHTVAGQTASKLTFHVL